MSDITKIAGESINPSAEINGTRKRDAIKQHWHEWKIVYIPLMVLIIPAIPAALCAISIPLINRKIDQNTNGNSCTNEASPVTSPQLSQKEPHKLNNLFERLKKDQSLKSCTIKLKNGIITINKPITASEFDELKIPQDMLKKVKFDKVILSATDIDTLKLIDSNGNCEIPEYVTAIASKAFKGNTDLKSITIPEGVTTIDYSAFSGCKSLTKITIPNSVTTIGSSAFWQCANLKTIQLPNDLETIGDYTFYDCKNLQAINIPKTVTTIGDSAFFYCEQLEKIELPNELKTIGNGTFAWCKSLKAINIPKTVTTIGHDAFYNCKQLAKIELPNKLETIGDNAFQDCSNLETIIFNGVPPGYDYDIFTKYNHPNDLCLKNATIIFTGQYSDQEIQDIFNKFEKSLKDYDCQLQFTNMASDTLKELIKEKAQQEDQTERLTLEINENDHIVCKK